MIQGLLTSLNELLPGVEHMFCLRHLYANFKRKFGGGVVIRNLMMAAAKATYHQEFVRKMEELKKANEAAFLHMCEIETQCWCKHAFTYYPLCDVLMNNLSESFNSTILLARDKPILTMFDWIRTYCMGRFATLMEKFQRYQGDVMPNPLKRLSHEVKRSGMWIAKLCGEGLFEVSHAVSPEGYQVNLKKRTCSCNFWELVGIPCRHACAAIARARGKPEEYVDSCYKREAYIKTYAHGITPMNGQNMWPETNEEYILPPLYKRGAGRPQKLRRRDPHEDAEDRLNMDVSCHNCSR